MRALRESGQRVAPYKCGPDYIDPMFHEEAAGVPSRNLDTYFSDGETVRELFFRGRDGEEIAVIEGAMGLFDGVGGVLREGSSYHLAEVTKTPILLVLDAKGMGRSILPVISGILSYDRSDLIKGVVLNRVSESYFQVCRELAKDEGLPVPLLGCFPEKEDFSIPSRHLGLRLPGELGYARDWARAIGRECLSCLPLPQILRIAEGAAEPGTGDPHALPQPATRIAAEPGVGDPIVFPQPASRNASEPGTGDPHAFPQPATRNASEPGAGDPRAFPQPASRNASEPGTGDPRALPQPASRIASDTGTGDPRALPQSASQIASEPGAGDPRAFPQSAARRTARIAVARDEAFCFYYEDNLWLLREMGAELVFFSPIQDEALPEGCGGLLLGGGYPELYAEKLSGNASMRASVRKAVEGGLPTVAECGGFLYLHRSLSYGGRSYPMAGALRADCFDAGKSVRFGYVELEERMPRFLPSGGKIKGHEFHHFESGDSGDGCLATKPFSGKRYPCVVAREGQWLGFPHLYYPSNPSFAENFVRMSAQAGRAGRAVPGKGSSRFFENRDCEYYPCHEGLEELNCLFCYCPLYARESCPGSPSYKERGGGRVKDCSGCAFPHSPGNYEAVLERLRQGRH